MIKSLEFLRFGRFWKVFLGLSLFISLVMPIVYEISSRYLWTHGFNGLSSATKQIGGIFLAAAIGLYILGHLFLIAVYGAAVVKTKAPGIWRKLTLVLVMTPISLLVLIAGWHIVDWYLAAAFSARLRPVGGSYFVGAFTFIVIMNLGSLVATCELAARGNRPDLAADSETG